MVFDFLTIATDNINMIVTHHREKLINAIIYFASHSKYCGKTKLLKLLYFLDFSHFKQTGKSVTGLDYFAWEMGPVPKDLFEELTDNMKPKKKFDSQYFSKKEMKLLEDLAFIFEDAKADTMVESTHLKNEPWDRTLEKKGEFKKIDYMLAIDSDMVSMPYDEAKERVQERSEMYKIFGAG